MTARHVTTRRVTAGRVTARRATSRSARRRLRRRRVAEAAAVDGRRRELVVAGAEDLLSFDAEEQTRFEEDDETIDAIHRILEFVRLRILLGVLEAFGAERTEQQREEKVQHLPSDRARNAGLVSVESTVRGRDLEPVFNKAWV